MNLRTRHRCVTFPRRPLVMGIVNINDDSFCNDGTLDPTAALAQARRQLEEGADVIDIGAESARTNREPISVEAEIARLRPFIEGFPTLLAEMPACPFDEVQLWPPLLSINTWRSEVIEAVLPLGGDLFNDISGLPNPRNAEHCARHGVALLIMHSVGQPKVAHTHVSYPDIMDTVHSFFLEKIQLALNAGLMSDQIVLDPGIDFAKQKEDNLILFRELTRLTDLGKPILLPVSRKTVIGQVLNQPNPLERDPGTIACVAAGMKRGAQLFRVHHVRATALTVKMLWALEENLPATP